LGVIVRLTVVSLAILTGSDFWIFLSLSDFLIVGSGTLPATMIKFPMSGILIAFPVGLKAAFTNEKDSPHDYFRDAIKLSKIGHELPYIQKSSPNIWHR
jgi:chemotaxis protein MotA